MTTGDVDGDGDCNHTHTPTPDYSFDFTKPTTRWALAEVAKTVQHVANISCLPKEEMQVGCMM
ncbi:hypothetical protein EON63_11615 [archaeon]|nr:MAG: hypothetical protein EON63_11615 [archaeon]